MAPFNKYQEYPQVTPHWLLGNESFGGITMLDNVNNFYKAVEGHRFAIFWQGNSPALFLRDVDLVKKVQVVELDHFTDLGFADQWYYDKVGNVFGLASMQGESWKRMKKSMTGPFSVPRVKKTIPAMNECSLKLVKYLKLHEKDEYVEGNVFLRKFFMNTIASVVFSLDIDCYGETETEFEKKGKGLISLTKFLVIKFLPTIAGHLKIKMLDTDSEAFFLKLAERIVEQRVNSQEESKDIMGTMLSIRKDNPDLSPEMMYKTLLQFFTDGYESAAMVISVLIHRLLFHPEVQERLQEEIDSVFENKNEGEFLDDKDINEMHYLDMVLLEGLRLGMIPSTERKCTKAWKIPGEDFVIPTNMNVIIPTGPMHLDPKFWDEPTKFNPERFSAENKGNIDPAVYQPFGLGLRACLGQNLVKMELKILLISLLRNFSMEPYGSITEDQPWDKDVFIGFSSVKMKLVSRF